MLTSRNHLSPKHLKQAVACCLLAIVTTPGAVGYQTEKAYAAERAATQTRGLTAFNWLPPANGPPMKN